MVIHAVEHVDLGDSGRNWYFITPDGRFYRWLGGNRNILANAVEIANVSVAAYDDPALLYDAQSGQSPPATASVSGNLLTIDPDDGFVGSFAATVTATDTGGLSDSRLILVTVNPATVATAARVPKGNFRPASLTDKLAGELQIGRSLPHLSGLATDSEIPRITTNSISDHEPRLTSNRAALGLFSGDEFFEDLVGMDEDELLILVRDQLQ